MRTLGDIDIRTDVPSFNVYQDGKLDSAVDDITELWRDDLVVFVLGCSYPFERALETAGTSVRNIENQY